MLQLSCWQSLNHSLPFGLKSAMSTAQAGQTGARCSLESIQEHAAIDSLNNVQCEASSEGCEAASVPDRKDVQVNPPFSDAQVPDSETGLVDASRCSSPPGDCISPRAVSDEPMQTQNGRGHWFTYFKGKLGLPKSRSAQPPSPEISTGAAKSSASPDSHGPPTPEPHRSVTPDPSGGQEDQPDLSEVPDMDWDRPRVSNRRTSRVAGEFKRPLPTPLDSETVPAKRHSASFELPGRPSYEALKHASDSQHRWSIASHSESQASEDDGPMRQQQQQEQQLLMHNGDDKQMNQPSVTPSNTPLQPSGAAEGEKQALDPTSFNKQDRRVRRAARRSEAIDRAFAQAMSDPEGKDFLPRVLEERSTLFGNNNDRQSSPQQSA